MKDLPKPDHETIQQIIENIKLGNFHKRKIFKEIIASDLVKLININNDIDLVDCRFSYEYNEGNIIGSYNIFQLSQLTNYLKNRTNNNSKIVFYCDKSNDRSEKIIYIFQIIYSLIFNNHLKDFYILNGGFELFLYNFPKYCRGKLIMMNDPYFTKLGLFKRDLLKFNSDFELKGINNYIKLLNEMKLFEKKLDEINFSSNLNYFLK